MPLPILLTIAYLVVNLAITYRLERDRASDVEPPRGLAALSATVRYGPPLLGLLYLEALAGDWLFVGFVVAFFALAFWLLNGLLNYPDERSRR